jgi:WD40 repeat protein
MAPAQAAAPAAPTARDPVLRVEAGGPTAFVTALAFSPDGKTLYAGGYDKVVHVWVLNPKTDRFELSPISYRVPIAAGTGGIINAVAVSADGKWVAVGGGGAVRGVGSHRADGWVVPRPVMTPEMHQDEGVIYAFNTTRPGEVRTLRGNEGPVLSLAFEPETDKGGPLLASAAREGDTAADRNTAVRLWDLGRAAGKEEVSARTGLPDPIHKDWVTAPGLAIYPAAQPLVAIACEDGRFRLWDVKQNKVWGDPAWDDDGRRNDGRFNTTAVYRPKEGRFLTTSLRGSDAFLQAWFLAADDSPWPQPDQQLSLGSRQIPRALALFSANADGRRDRAAVVLRGPGKDPDITFSLRLIDLKAFKTVAESVPLWVGPGNEPVVAASPAGRHLAVAGNADNTIHLYAIKDLLAGKAEMSQDPLRSDGAAMRYVGFVTHGKDKPGLLLNETRGPGKGEQSRPRAPARGDLVFDFGGRVLTTDLDGWKTDAPDLRDWDVKAKDEGKEGTVLRVWHDKQEKGKVVLPPEQELTSYALLPSAPLTEKVRGPLLAVAVLDAGGTLLRLYDVATGEPVRQCTGPVNMVRSLAFSGDGRLLAAAAADQTVCVWSLTDLKKVVGQHGSLRGLAVKDDGKGHLVLAELDGKLLLPANRERLKGAGVRAGDRVEGLVTDGQLTTPTATPREFYQAVWQTAPLKKAKRAAVTVRVTGRGDVALDLSQGVDERKPLLSLFVTAGRGGTPRAWVGWNPIGPYDSSGRDAERLIGWHVNTGATDKPPVSFTLADQSHKDDFMPGILEKLVTLADVADAINALKPAGPPPDPQMNVGVKDGGVTVPPNPDRPKYFRVGQRRVTLTLALDGFPADKVGSVAWRALRKEGKLKSAGDNEWSADLADLPWERGDQTVEVVLHTAAPYARDYKDTVTVCYQPPAPVLEARREHPGVTKEKEYPIAFKVLPHENQAVKVTVLLRQGEGKPVQKWETVGQAPKVETVLTLAPGRNLIQVIAENRDAPVGAAGKAERTHRDLLVTYMVPRPQIALKKLVSGESEQRIDPTHPGEVLVVDVPTFRVVGEIESLVDLVSAEWAEGKNAPAPLAGFKAAANVRKAAIDQEITLAEPGQRKVRFLAAVKGEKEEYSVTVDYRPRLPGAALNKPGEQQNFYGAEAPKVPVEVALLWRKEGRHPCEAQLVVNDEAVGKPQAIGKDQKTFRGEATLRPGENKIAVRLRNEWHKEWAVGAATVVYYRRPPRVVTVEAAKPGAKPRVQVVATVESVKGLPLTGAEFKVFRGQEAAGKPVQTIQVPKAELPPPEGDKGTVWTIRQEVTLDPGDNVIEVVAFNEDGRSLKPGRTAPPVHYDKPPPARPDVTFLDPTYHSVVEVPEFPVRFAVKSESPLTVVELWRGEEERLYSATPADLKGQKKKGEFFEFEVTRRVALKRGDNFLHTVTVNQEGGRDHTPVVAVVYHYRPVVHLHIDALEVKGKERTPTGAPDKNGALPFAKVEGTGRVTLRGHVEWDEAHDAALKGLRHVEVCVNGYHQPPALLDAAPRGERSRAFRVEVLLNQKENIVDVVPPRADPQFLVEAASRKRCKVECTSPAEVQRQLLHLLVIDVYAKEADATKEALDAALGYNLKGTAFGVDYCKEGGLLYGPVAGDEVRRERVIHCLGEIRKALEDRAAKAGALNDIVMVYYRGGTVTKGREHYLRTSLNLQSPEPLESELISCDLLSRFFGDNPGANLMFLDVTGAPASGPGSAERRADVVGGRSEPYVGALGYTWSGDKQPENARLWNQGLMKESDTVEDFAKKARRTFDKNKQLSDLAGKLGYEEYMPPGGVAGISLRAVKRDR